MKAAVELSGVIKHLMRKYDTKLNRALRGWINVPTLCMLGEIFPSFSPKCPLPLYPAS